ncbi:hypothetical protein ACHAWX_007114 [Stephanocyclus meneghinianus]
MTAGPYQTTLLLSTAILHNICGHTSVTINVASFLHHQLPISKRNPTFRKLRQISHRCSCLNENRDTDDATSNDGFWRQPSSLLKSCLSSLPPKEILDQIRSQPYKGGFEPVSDFIQPQALKIIYGSIPKDLVGTLAVNGSGRIRIGSRMLGHWFDGDGYLTTLSFDGRKNQATVFGKYVRTARFVAQEMQEKRGAGFHSELHRSEEYKPPLAFSGAWTKAGRGRFYENIVEIPQNPSNTAVMWLPSLTDSKTGHAPSKPRLFALCEGGHPIEVDPITLDVLHGEQPFESSPSSTNVHSVSSFFSAHYSADLKENTIYNHGYILNLFASPSINLMKLSPEGHLLQQKKCDMPYNTFVHDSTISKTFVVYIVCPYLIPSGLDLIPFVVGQQPLGGLMKWRGGHHSHDTDRYFSYLHIHDKKDLSLKHRIQIPHPMSVFHLVDAFEEEKDDLVYLKVRMAELASNNPPCNRPLLEEQFANQYAVPTGTRLHSTLKEYTFVIQHDDTGAGRFLACRNIYCNSGDSIPCDYPIINTVGGTVRVRYTWVNTIAARAIGRPQSDWFDAVQKVDMENGGLSSPPVTFGEDVYCGPPLFIAKDKLHPHPHNNSRTQHFGEDEGYIVVVLYLSKEHRSDVAILDAQSMEILCRMELGCHLTYSFHGEFLPGFVAIQ